LYGRVKVTSEHLQQMVRNFDAGTYGQTIFFDVEHRSDKGAAGEITALRFDGEYLLADVTWTAHGVSAIKDKRHELVSAEFTEEFTDPETGDEAGAVLFGAALTTRPFVKRMQRVQLSEDGGTTTIYTPDLPDETNAMNARQRLLAKLQSLGLSEAHQQSLLAKFDKAAITLSDQLEALEATADAMIDSAKIIAAAIVQRGASDTPSTETTTLSEEKVADIVATKLAEAETARTQKLAEQANKETAARKVFTDAVAAAESLDEETRTALSEQAPELVSAGMSDAAIKKLADTLVKSAEREEAAKKLGSMGFTPPTVGGTPRISVDHTNEVMRFSEQVYAGLRQTSSFATGKLCLPAEDNLNNLAKQYLSAFNAEHAPRLLQEARMLSDVGQANVGQYWIPESFTREVIREALAELNIFQLLRTVVEPSQSSTFNVPYEITNRGEIRDRAVLVERQMYPRVASRTARDIGYLLKRGAMIDVSEEAEMFTRGGPVNYDAWASALARCSRIMREIIHADAANHLLRINDSAGALPTTAETLDYANTDDSVIKLANFPLVQPHQMRDLNGNAIGAADNPIVLTIGGSVIPMFTGEPGLAAGTYYVVQEYNQGLLRLVDELGVPVTDKPAGTIDYWYSTNVTRFNTDVPANTENEKHLNRLLQAVGQGKSRMMQDQYFQPDYVLMAHTVDDNLSNAQQFVQTLKVPGSESNAKGVRKIKDLRTVTAAAPGMNLGENRILIGISGNSTYHVAKPWSFGQPRPADVTDAAGDARFTGATVTHANEFSGIHTPSPHHGRSTSILVYSAADREAL
jgi:hypothetical protein